MSPVTGSSAAPPYSPPAASGNNAARSSAAKSSFVPSPAAPPAPAPSVPASSTVTLSDQARNTFASAGSMTAAPMPVPASSSSGAGSSTYESMKMGIAGAVGDIEDIASEGFHAVTNGVETLVSSANTLVRGVLDSPFVVVAKICDAAGVVIDQI
jgi:hypothetical protein